LDPVQALQAVGWSELEARVYVTLIESDEPLTGYQIAKAARLARANVYTVVERLIRRGALVEEPGGPAPRYRAVPFDAVARGQLASVQKSLDAVLTALPDVKSRSRLVAGRGEDAVWTHGLALISAAHGKIDIGASHGTVAPFAAALQEARQRGVEENFFCFDNCPPPGCGVCQNPVPVFSGDFNPKGWLVLVGEEDTLVTVGSGDDAELVLTNMAPIRETLQLLFSSRVPR
jgi:predicted transcriptional regulator